MKWIEKSNSAMENYKGIIFDLDGVIVDTVRIHYLSWRKLAGSLGFDITSEQNEELKGISRAHSLEKVLKWGNIEATSEEFEQLLVRKNEDYLERISDLNENDMLPGVSDILDYLTERDIPYVLASASGNARIILKKLGIYDRFSAITDGNDVLKTKPNPEIFYTAAKELNKAPENCLVFEDSIAGVKAAKLAGMEVIGIGEKSILKQADYNFTDFTEVDHKFMDHVVMIGK